MNTKLPMPGTIFCRIVCHSLAPWNLLEATALLVIGMIGSARFEMWRINRINRRFGR